MRGEALHGRHVHVARVRGEALHVGPCGIDGGTAAQGGVFRHAAGEHARDFDHGRAVGAIRFDVEGGENFRDADEFGGHALRRRGIGNDVAVVGFAHEEAIVATFEAHEVIAALRATNADFIRRAGERGDDRQRGDQRQR